MIQSTPPLPCLDTRRRADDMERPRRVQLIVNAVSATRCADAVLALGGSPCMGATTAEEAEETSGRCDATLLNFGTPTSEAIAKSVLDARVVVVDPVGVGLRTRGEVIRRWLDARAQRVRDAASTRGVSDMITVIKGNRSEIEALLRMYEIEGTLGANVSVTPDSEAAADEDENGVLAALRSLVKRVEGERDDELETLVVLCTGPVDYVVSRCNSFARRESHVESFSHVSGAGCVLGAVVAWALATHRCASDRPLTVNVCGNAASVYRRIGFDAENDLESHAPASFFVRFMDALFQHKRSFPDMFERWYADDDEML